MIYSGGYICTVSVFRINKHVYSVRFRFKVYIPGDVTKVYIIM